MWKSLLLIAAATAFGVVPVAMNSNEGQTAKHAQKAAAQPAAQEADKADANAEAMDKAKKLYAIDCALCHGDKGLGDTDLAKQMKLTLKPYGAPDSVSAMTDQQIFDLIRKGKDQMPPEAEARAKDAELHDLVAYIRKLAKENPAAAPASGSAEPAPQNPQ